MDPTPPTAGPSSTRSDALDYSRYLLQPTNVHPSSLSGTDDLISLFELDTLYNTFLRPYLPPTPTTTAAAAGEPPSNANSPSVVPPTAIKGQVSIKGKEKQAPDSPAMPTPGGFKITLGGIKFTSAGEVPTAKVKRVKMEKNYAHLVQDILGRNSIKKDEYLTHLVMNPDPVPCPPLTVPDSTLLREALTLKPGQLAGFDMTVWEDATGEPGEKKRKKKRKQQLQPPEGDPGVAHKKLKQ
ncbi:uncharacterized protein JCM15063_004313 [Sporobolomyces koalae]|uniref:uncharacterized protein n=1 Tax=Sporobolomyces koalae TaxID=500713 RepID=UPI0031813E46